MSRRMFRWQNGFTTRIREARDAGRGEEERKQFLIASLYAIFWFKPHDFSAALDLRVSDCSPNAMAMKISELRRLNC